MGNELDEITGPTNSAGRDINVVDKQLKIEVGFGTKLFEIAIWVVGVLLALIVGYAATLSIGAAIGISIV